MTPPNNHGGSRPGAGRPTYDKTMPHAVQVRMDAELYAHLSRLATDWEVERPEALRRVLRGHLETYRS